MSKINHPKLTTTNTYNIKEIMSNDKVKSFNVGNIVKVVSVPIVDNNEYGQSVINNTVGKIGKVDRVAKNGLRNICIKFEDYNYNYYGVENLELTNEPLKPRQYNI